METQDKDTMANIALVVGVLVILATVIFLVSRLMSVIDANSIKGGEKYAEEKAALVGERLQRVGSVNVASASTEAAGPRSADNIVTGVCASCHGTGVLDAPKLDDSAAWAPRFAQGMPTLMDHAINGFNSMPPRGGDASLSDDDMKAAVEKMLKDAGIEVGGDAAPVAAEAPAPAAEEKKAEVTETPAATEAAVATETPAPAETPAAAVTPEVAPAPKVVADAADVVPAPLEGETDVMEQDKVAEAPKAEVAAVVAPAPEAKPAAAGSDKGKEIYKKACFSCHDHGVAGAPKLGDIEAWAPRIAAGKDALYNSATNGKGAMPPKGGRVDLSNEVIQETVDYMVSLSGG